MPTSEQIKDIFYTRYSSELLDLLTDLKERDLLKREDSGNLSYEFVEFILYNIDILKSLKL